MAKRSDMDWEACSACEKLLIAIDAAPKGRPRFSRSGQTYTDQKTKKYEAEIGRQLVAQVSHAPLECPIWLRATFYTTNTADIDNLLKALMDGANGVIWQDDRWVKRVDMEKRFPSEDGPKIELEVRW